MNTMHVDSILDLLRDNGSCAYLGEQVTQLEHALQCATLAEEAGESLPLVLACLLHDVGHLVRLGTEDRNAGDDGHEGIGARLLARCLPPGVTEPIRLHVSAKRYLVANDPSYRTNLSEASMYSLEAQGGAMSAAECAQFEAEPHADDAVRLRRYDERGKTPGFATLPLEHFEPFIHALASTMQPE